jgi:hypothetical protein
MDTHHCKQVGCDQDVKYVPHKVFSMSALSIDSIPESHGTKTVYLTCPKRHTQPYEVNGKGDICG